MRARPSRPPSGSSPGRALKSSVSSLNDRYLEFAGTTIALGLGDHRRDRRRARERHVGAVGLDRPEHHEPGHHQLVRVAGGLRDQLGEPERPARALDVEDLDAVVELRVPRAAWNARAVVSQPPPAAAGRHDRELPRRVRLRRVVAAGRAARGDDRDERRDREHPADDSARVQPIPHPRTPRYPAILPRRAPGIASPPPSPCSHRRLRWRRQPKAAPPRRPRADRTSDSTPTVPQPTPKDAEARRRRPTKLDPAKTYVATVKTNCGDFEITLDAEARAEDRRARSSRSPTRSFYDGHDDPPHRARASCFQGGDPQGNGTGGPGYSVEEKPPERPGLRRRASWRWPRRGDEPSRARRARSSSSSPATDARASSPPDYALLGQITGGEPVVEKIGAIITDPRTDLPDRPVRDRVDPGDRDRLAQVPDPAGVGGHRSRARAGSARASPSPDRGNSRQPLRRAADVDAQDRRRSPFEHSARASSSSGVGLRRRRRSDRRLLQRPLVDRDAGALELQMRRP